MAERERAGSEQRHADRLYNLKACELDQRAVDLAAADEETRKNITAATKEYNLALVCLYQHYESSLQYRLTVHSNNQHIKWLVSKPVKAKAVSEPV